MKNVIILLILSYPLFSKAEKILESNKVKRSSAALRLRIKLSDATADDTLIVRYYTRYYPIEDSLPEKDKYLILQKDGFYHISIYSQSPFGYFCLVKKNNPAHYGMVAIPFTNLTKEYYWEAGDDIDLYLKLMPKDTLLPSEKRTKYLIRFSGKGSEKYRISAIAQNELVATHFNRHNNSDDSNGIYHHLQGLGMLRACETLDRNRLKITQSAYYVLKADVLFFNSSLRFRDIKRYYWSKILCGTEQDRHNFRTRFDSVFQSLYKSCGIPDKYLSRSKYFPEYCLGEFETKTLLNLDVYPGKYLFDMVSQDSLYFAVKSRYNGVLRDKLLAYVIYNPVAYKPINYSLLLSDALKSIKTKAYKDFVHDIYDARSGSATLYNFDLIDSSGKTVMLNSFKGKTILLDFYFNGCGPCNAYYNEVLKPVEMAFASNKSIVFLSISADLNMNWFKQGLRSGKYCSPNSIHLFTNGKGSDDPIIKYYKISAFPTVILLGPDGKMLECNSRILYNEHKLIDRLTELSTKATLSSL